MQIPDLKTQVGCLELATGQSRQLILFILCYHKFNLDDALEDLMNEKLHDYLTLTDDVRNSQMLEYYKNYKKSQSNLNQEYILSDEDYITLLDVLIAEEIHLDVIASVFNKLGQNFNAAIKSLVSGEYKEMITDEEIKAIVAASEAKSKTNNTAQTAASAAAEPQAEHLNKSNEIQSTPIANTKINHTSQTATSVRQIQPSSLEDKIDVLVMATDKPRDLVARTLEELCGDVDLASEYLMDKNQDLNDLKKEAAKKNKIKLSYSKPSASIPPSSIYTNTGNKPVTTFESVTKPTQHNTLPKANTFKPQTNNPNQTSTIVNESEPSSPPDKISILETATGQPRAYIADILGKLHDELDDTLEYLMAPENFDLSALSLEIAERIKNNPPTSVTPAPIQANANNKPVIISESATKPTQLNTLPKANTSKPQTKNPSQTTARVIEPPSSSLQDRIEVLALATGQPTRLVATVLEKLHDDLDSTIAYLNDPKAFDLSELSQEVAKKNNIKPSTSVTPASIYTNAYSNPEATSGIDRESIHNPSFKTQPSALPPMPPSSYSEFLTDLDAHLAPLSVNTHSSKIVAHSILHLGGINVDLAKCKKCDKTADNKYLELSLNLSSEKINMLVEALNRKIFINNKCRSTKLVIGKISVIKLPLNELITNINEIKDSMSQILSDQKKLFAYQAYSNKIDGFAEVTAKFNKLFSRYNEKFHSSNRKDGMMLLLAKMFGYEGISLDTTETQRGKDYIGEMTETHFKFTLSVTDANNIVKNMNQFANENVARCINRSDDIQEICISNHFLLGDKFSEKFKTLYLGQAQKSATLFGAARASERAKPENVYRPRYTN